MIYCSGILTERQITDYSEKPKRRVNLFKGIIVDVTTDMVELSNGASTLREVVHHPGGVGVLPIDEDGSCYMVRQYRYPVGAPVLEIPAGKIDHPAAMRELSEETGLEADVWTELGAIYTSPGFSTETLYLYLATGLHQGSAHPDPNEFLDVERMPLAELLSRIDRCEIRDAKTVIGALRAERVLRAGN